MELKKILYGELSYALLGLQVTYNSDGTIKENEIEIVDNAVKNSNLSLKEIVKHGTLQRARYLNSIAKTQAKLDSMSSEEVKAQTVKGVANYRISQAIALIIDHNNQQAEKKHKVCLTKGIVFKLTGSNRQTINKYFARHQTKISDHNQKHSLTGGDNRKGKGFSIEKLLGSG